MHMEIWCTFAHIEFWPPIPYPTFCDGSKDETARKIPGYSGPVFHIFPIIFVLFGKYGKRYENGIGCRGNRSGYSWACIPSVFVLGGKIR
jgi:hypothetical protein